MLKSKKKILFLILFLFFLWGALVFVDNKTTYLISIDQNDVEIIDKNIVIEMSSGTSVGRFKNVKLKELKTGIYSIEVYFSLLTGEPDGYKYKIDNSDNHIKEIRQYSLDGSDEYILVYQYE